MTPADEIRAVLTRAAQAEARRQAAERKGDERTADAALDELRELWRRYGQLECTECTAGIGDHC